MRSLPLSEGLVETACMRKSARILHSNARSTIGRSLRLGLLLANENGSALPDVADLSKKYYVGASFAYPPGGAEFKKPCIGCTHSVGRCFDEGLSGRPNYCDKYRLMKKHYGRCPVHKAKYVCQRSCGWCRPDTEAMPPKQ